MSLPSDVLTSIVAHYHRVLCESPKAQRLVVAHGFGDPELLRAFHVGYSDGTLLKKVPRAGELRDKLQAFGLITDSGREALSGCVVVPLTDPDTGAPAGSSV